MFVGLLSVSVEWIRVYYKRASETLIKLILIMILNLNTSTVSQFTHLFMYRKIVNKQIAGVMEIGYRKRKDIIDISN